MLHNNPFGTADLAEARECLLTNPQLQPPKRKSSAVLRWLKNGWRTLISPVTQVIMAVGVFPAQTLSTIKKIPVLKSVVGFITRKLGHDSRSAAETFQADFVERTEPESRKGFLGA